MTSTELVVSRMHDAALACVRAGVSIIPIDHANKRPAMRLLPQGDDGKATWKPYQTRLPSEAEVRRWCDAGIQSFAVVCGKVSGGLLVLDFDAPEFFARWKSAVGDLAEGLPVQQTGGGGFQVLLRCPDPGGNDKLAWMLDEQEHAGRTIAIETRGEGGYAVVAPSLHPSGTNYAWLAGDASSAPSISQELAERLIKAARELDEAPLTRQERERLEAQARTSHNRQRSQRNGQASVIDAFNEAHSIEALLEVHGYTKGPQGRYIRPGGASESVSVKDGRSCHWSSDDPLNDGAAISGCGCHDAFDVYCHFEHAGDFRQAVRAAAELLGMSKGRSSDSNRTSKAASRDKDMPVPRLQFDPFPVDVLPDPLQTFVREASKSLGCDPSFIALPLLAGCASAIGNAKRIELKRGWTEPAILWTVIVGDSGTQKSPAIELALRAVRKRQAEAMKKYEVEMEDFKTAYMTYERDLSEWKKAKKDGQPPIEPEEPIADRCWCDDATIESLVWLLRNAPRGLLMVRDELAGWIMNFGRYAGKGGNASGEAAKWLEMHGGRSVMVDRKTTVPGMPRTIHIPRAAVSIAGGIQPGILQKALTPEHRESGLAARLLVAFPPKPVRRWTDADVDPQIERSLADTIVRMFGIPSDTDKDGDPQPGIVRLTPDAKRLWIDFYNAHALEHADLSGDLSAAWSKLEGYAARIALVIHFVRWSAGDESLVDVGAIDAASLAAGVRLSQWFGNEAKRVYAMLAEDDSEQDQRELVDLIQRKGGAISTRDLMRCRDRQFPAADDAESALNGLVQHGWGQWETIPPTKNGGPPTFRFVLTGSNAKT